MFLSIQRLKIYVRYSTIYGDSSFIILTDMLSGPSALLFFKLDNSFPTSLTDKNGISKFAFVLFLIYSFSEVGHWYLLLDSMFLGVSIVSDRFKKKSFIMSGLISTGCDLVPVLVLLNSL